MMSYFKTFLIGVLFADFLERRFHNEVVNFITTVVYDVLYLYSKCELCFIKIKKMYDSFLEDNNLIETTEVETISVFKLNGESASVNYSVKHKEKFNYGKDLMDTFGKPDMFLYSWTNKDNKCRNVKIIYNINEGFEKPEASNIKFILVELNVGEKSYKIDLKTDNFNYYLVGNKVTKHFFIYYLKSY